ncbi:hypothetical protein Ga0080559_TMP3342 [Salipiger profundus]|uniref:Uncharacterized protein n=1 Tax=Salipiger profundus TaxID=1229727 RepID=A0A1U7D7Q2_9RHOB|nr:hypothetical protein Ga0080559_TMP3342 [Salipiger profundus]
MTGRGENFLYRSDSRMNWTHPASLRFTRTRPLTTDKDQTR